MITKIFYSLMLFPEIQYGTIFLGKYSILALYEKGKGEIEIIFSEKIGKTESITFSHKDCFQKLEGFFETKNWFIFGSNTELVQEVFQIILEKDTKDFNFFKDKEFYDSIPFGTVLTITSKCNLFCNYCFNDYDYDLKTRNFRDNIGLEKYKEIVDILYESGTRDIIITGGEPFSAPFLFDLLAYIRDKGIFIRINTNGTLLFDKILYRLNTEFSLNLMVSMHEFNNKDYFEINKVGAKNILGVKEFNHFKFKFSEKVKQLKKIKNHRNLTLDFLTILTPKNILYLDTIYRFVLQNFQLENWHFFRLYSTERNIGISREMIGLAIYKIYKLNQKYNTNFKIVDSVPFCVVKNTEIARQVIDGELSEHHNVKTIITTDGYIQIMSAFDSNLGSIFENDLLEVWRGDFVTNMLKNGFLPDECQDCRYKEECRGGSRMDANIFNGSYGAFDPLGNIVNKKTWM